MKVSRREFLATTPVVAGAMLPFKGMAFGKTTALDDDVLRGLTWDSFYPYINTSFTFRDETGNAVGLQLVRMDDTRPVGYKPRGNGDECFALIFSGPLKRPLKQDVFLVEHFALGNFTLLITVLESKNKRHHYEAVINRIVG